jgi:hypothetical protein
MNSKPYEEMNGFNVILHNIYLVWEAIFPEIYQIGISQYQVLNSFVYVCFKHFAVVIILSVSELLITVYNY